MKCKCETKMNHVFSDHYTAYVDMYWCPICGRLLHTDRDAKTFMTPIITLEQK